MKEREKDGGVAIQFDLQSTIPGSIAPPHVNICPPSPLNNMDPKTNNFNM